MKRALLGAGLLALSACGGGGQSPSGCDDAVLFIDWTINGAAPSTQSCQGIDHMTVAILADCDQETIDPVPCTLDKFRYDDVPSGDATVQVTAVDAAGATKAFGSFAVNLTPNPPPSPVGIPLTTN